MVSSFNKRIHKSKPPKFKHYVEDYKAAKDFVRCICGFEGSVDSFTEHVIENKPRRADASYTHRGHVASLKYLSDIALARSTYPINGVLHSFRGYRGD